MIEGRNVEKLRTDWKMMFGFVISDLENVESDMHECMLSYFVIQPLLSTILYPFPWQW